MLFLVAPVRFSVKHLRRDPHYGHAGISVLPGAAAGWVATTFLGETEYEVETLPTRAWTVRQLRRFGMDLIDIELGGRAAPGPPAVRRVVDELRQSFTLVARRSRRARRRLSGRLSPPPSRSGGRNSNLRSPRRTSVDAIQPPIALKCSSSTEPSASVASSSS